MPWKRVFQAHFPIPDSKRITGPHHTLCTLAGHHRPAPVTCKNITWCQQSCCALRNVCQAKKPLTTSTVCRRKKMEFWRFWRELNRLPAGIIGSLLTEAVRQRKSSRTNDEQSIEHDPAVDTIAEMCMKEEIVLPSIESVQSTWLSGAQKTEPSIGCRHCWVHSVELSTTNTAVDVRSRKEKEMQGIDRK